MASDEVLVRTLRESDLEKMGALDAGLVGRGVEGEDREGVVRIHADSLP